MDANADLADPDRLSIGQKLNVPAGASAPAPAPGAADGAERSGAGCCTNASTATTDEATATLDKLAQQYGVDASLLRALAWIDTDGKPRRLDAPGALGYLTVTDKTFEYIQQTLVKRTLDRDVPGDNLEAGVAYVASMLKWGGDESKGLAGFLQGPGSVRENGVRPNIDQQVKRILALRDKLKSGGSPRRPRRARARGVVRSAQSRAAACRRHVDPNAGARDAHPGARAGRASLGQRGHRESGRAGRRGGQDGVRRRRADRHLGAEPGDGSAARRRRRSDVPGRQRRQARTAGRAVPGERRRFTDADRQPEGRHQGDDRPERQRRREPAAGGAEPKGRQRQPPGAGAGWHAAGEPVRAGDGRWATRPT